MDVDIDVNTDLDTYIDTSVDVDTGIDMTPLNYPKKNRSHLLEICLPRLQTLKARQGSRL